MPESIRDKLFAHTLDHLEYGQTHDKLDQTLLQCIRAAQLTGKKSTITLTLTINPKQSGNQVFITPTVKSVQPKLPAEETLFFPTEDGDLKRNDPRQQLIPGLKEVSADDVKQFKIAREN